MLQIIKFLLAVSSGFFIHVVIHDLLPKRSHHESGVVFLKHVLLVLIGALLMGFVANALQGSHEHGHEEEVYINGEEEHGHEDEHVDEETVSLE